MYADVCKILFLIVGIFLSSHSVGQEAVEKVDQLPIFKAKSVVLPGKNVGRYVPVIDSYVKIPDSLDMKGKLEVIADSLSRRSFNGLEIQIVSIDSTISDGRILIINLKEPDDFNPWAPHPGFTTWHAFFQGSSQGTDTGITLVESFLQRYFEGDWIDAMKVEYRGEPIYEMDHINLSGVIRRYR